MPLPLLRIGPDRETSGRSAAARLGRRDRNAGVDRDDAGLVGENRIEIDLADLGKIRCELRELDQEKSDGLFVRRRHVAVGLEDARHPGAGDQVARQRQIERRQRQRLVVDHLDRGAALAEDDDRTEGRIVGEADDELARLRPHDHGKHGHAVDPRIGLGGARPIEDLRRGLAHVLLGDEIEPHAADFRLVHDVGR